MPRLISKKSSHRARLVRILLLTALLLLQCNVWQTVQNAPALPSRLENNTPLSTASPIALHAEAAVNPPTPTPAPPHAPASVGEPAGCRTVMEMESLHTLADGLRAADDLLHLQLPLANRTLGSTWNAFSHTFTADGAGVISLNVGNVENEYLIQNMLNALQVSGFVTWLRKTPEQGLHILALWLPGSRWQDTPWWPYLQAYWQDRAAQPSGDHDILPVLKLPPCEWMVSQGYAPSILADWWQAQSGTLPDYATPAAAYLADSNAAAAQVAHKINWLGAAGDEGPNTMCGPLAWSILHDAGVFPPGWGAWVSSPRAFWLAKPRENGRPWALFPPGTYRSYAFRDALGKFDFRYTRLYPGDFLYTYSKGDGYDHMFVITEVDQLGNVYTVTNIIQMKPVQQTTIQRVLLLNINDPSVGIARNQWADDRENGRTGQAGFEIFRWAWMEKDIRQQPALVLIQPGDTLGLLAERWKTPAETIARYNGIASDGALRVGQYLSIPPNEAH